MIYSLDTGVLASRFKALSMADMTSQRRLSSSFGATTCIQSGVLM